MLKLQMQELNEQLQALKPEEQVAVIQEFLKEKPELRDAVVVRLFDGSDTNMYGKTVADNITLNSKMGKTRYSLQIHPYVWKPSGASIVPVWKNEQGLPHVALVHNQRKDKDIKLWRLPEGFMHPKPCPGSEKVTLIHPDIMDEAEELILNKSLDVKTAYERTIKKFENKTINVDGEQAYDNSLEDTAKREAKEEVGLELKDLTIKSLGFNTSGIIHHWFLADLNQINSPFKSNIEAPTLTPDGIEIKEAKWISIENFAFNVIEDQLQLSTDGVIVPMKYALMIGQALSSLYNTELEKNSKGLFSERRNAAKHFKFFQFKNEKESYTKIYGHNPGKTLRQQFGLNTKEDLLSNIKNIPGNNPQEQISNWNSLAYIGIYALQQQQTLRKNLNF